MKLSFRYHRRFEGVLPPRRTPEPFFVLTPITVEIAEADVEPKLVLEHRPNGMDVTIEYFGVPGREGLFTKLNMTRVEAVDGRAGDLRAVADFNIGLGVPPEIEYRLHQFDRQGEPIHLLQPETNREFKKLDAMPRVRRIDADYGAETESELIEHFKAYVALPDGTVLVPQYEPYVGVELETLLYTIDGVAKRFGEPSRIAFRVDEEERCEEIIRHLHEPQAEALVDTARMTFRQWRVVDASFLRFNPERAQVSWLAHQVILQVTPNLSRLPTRQMSDWATFRAFWNRWTMGWEGETSDLVRELHPLVLELERFGFIKTEVVTEVIGLGEKWLTEQASEDFAGLAP